jgi:hypothetical protein
MINTNIDTSLKSFDFEKHIGWKYYSKIKKKAMEQEFSWVGLFISLSIAFFVVITSVYILNAIYLSIEKNILIFDQKSARIYKLENIDIESLLRSNSVIIENKIKFMSNFA